MAEGDATKPSLAESLANALPKDYGFHFYHISTPPTRCLPLYSPPQGMKPERTYCERHFLNVSIAPVGGSEEIFIYAVEVFVYSTRQLTTVFVSKADSTGFLSVLNVPRSYSSPLRSITTTFLSWLVQHRQRPGKDLVLSLFARAQDQYLFPGSVENPTKHVASDRELVRWWCRVVNPLLRATDINEAHAGARDIAALAYLIVPGADSTASFLPPAVRSDPALRRRWKDGHPLYDIAPFPAAAPRCLVPRFPDDPKARFVDELDADLQDNTAANVTSSQQESPSKRGRGVWKSVKTLEQFWEMMAFRQECASGRLVGFLWLVFEPPQPLNGSDGLGDSQLSTVSSSLDEMSAASLADIRRREEKNAPEPPKHERKRLTGPIIPRLPRVKSSGSTFSAASLPATSLYYFWPQSARGSLVLSEKDYKRVTELLLKLDFADCGIAAQGTKQWVDEVAVYADTPQWGFTVTGRAEPIVAAANGGNVNAVTVLSVKRKAKALETNANGDVKASQVDGPNVLGAGLVRKKPKVEASEEPQGSSLPIANVLGAGLIRKKPKAG